MAEERHGATAAGPPSARRRRVPAWISFGILRVLCMVVPLVVLLALGVNTVIALAVSLVVAAILSNLFLRRQRTAFALELDRLRRGQRLSPESPRDEDAEDAAVADASAGPDAPGPTTAASQNAKAAARPTP